MARQAGATTEQDFLENGAFYRGENGEMYSPSTLGVRGGALKHDNRLGKVSDEINRASDAESIARIVAAEGARLCSTDMASVYLFTADGELEHCVGLGLDPPFAREIEKYGRTRWATHELAPRSGPFAVALSAEGPFPSPIHKRAAAEGMSQLISAPLCRGDQLVGVLLLYRRTEQPLVDTTRDLLSTLANMGALAVVHARVIEAREWERKAQDQFLDVLGHELRTPLTSIMGFAQMIRRRYSMLRDADPRIKEQLDLLWAQVQRLHRLLDTFADMSNLERGEFAVGHEQLDLAAVLSLAIEQALSQTRTRHHLNIDVPDHPVLIQGDTRRLEHAFVHVLSNAIRYSPPDQPISVTCTEPSAGEVSVSVSDCGPGIPSELRREIFKRFYPSDSRKTGGMGMGLYFSRAIVDAHGGRLTIESSPGQGTTVHVNLPVR